VFASGTGPKKGLCASARFDHHHRARVRVPASFNYRLVVRPTHLKARRSGQYQLHDSAVEDDGARASTTPASWGAI